MIIAGSALLLAMPFVVLLLLVSTRSEFSRRTWLMGVALTVFINAVWYLVVRWAFLKTDEVQAMLSPQRVGLRPFFEGIGGTILTSFYSDPRFILVYALSIVLLGHFANQQSLRRIKGKNLESSWTTRQ